MFSGHQLICGGIVLLGSIASWMDGLSCMNVGLSVTSYCISIENCKELAIVLAIRSFLCLGMYGWWKISSWNDFDMFLGKGLTRCSNFSCKYIFL